MAKSAQAGEERKRRPAWSVWFAFPEPWRGGLMLAQGKAAEAAALGKRPPNPTSFFPSGWARRRRTQPEGKKEASFGVRTPLPNRPGPGT
jgi:hypothetical protein